MGADEPCEGREKAADFFLGRGVVGGVYNQSGDNDARQWLLVPSIIKELKGSSPWDAWIEHETVGVENQAHIRIKIENI